MFDKFSTSLKLVKLSFSYIRQEWELFVYALLSFISSIIVFLSIVWVDILYIEKLNNLNEDNKKIAFYVMLFIYYLIMYFITFFFNTAIITSVQRKLNWMENKFWDWIRDSMKHIWKILQWSLVASTVALILRILEENFKNNFIWKFIIWLMWWAWSILTFFAFPIMILEWKWPIDAIKESSSLFKKTWWERAILHVGTWFFFWMLIILVAIFAVWLSITVNVFLWIWIWVLWIFTLIILSSLTDVIITTVLFHYASTQTVPQNIEERSAFANIAKTL